MVTITLPPELEQVVTEQAARQGTTPELLTLDKLRGLLLPVPSAEPEPELDVEGGTMLDFFSGYVGVIHSSEVAPGGAKMSEDIERKFTEGMLAKRQEGRL